MTLNDEEKFIFNMANADVFGIFADMEIAPLDSTFCDFEMGACWEDDKTHCPDEAFEWLCEYFEDLKSSDFDELKEKFQLTTKNSKKWDLIADFQDCSCDFPDDMTLYHYEMKSQLVGVCFTQNEAIRLKNAIDSDLNPTYHRLSRYELKGYGELKEIVDYFRNKAKEMFKE